MNEFDRRWKLGAEAARRAAAALPDEAPFGFATRVVAHWRAAGAPPLATLWQQFSLRVLGGVALAAVLIAAAHLAFGTDGDSFTPDVASTVSEMFWML